MIHNCSFICRQALSSLYVQQVASHTDKFCFETCIANCHEQQIQGPQAKIIFSACSSASVFMAFNFKECMSFITNYFQIKFKFLNNMNMQQEWLVDSTESSQWHAFTGFEMSRFCPVCQCELPLFESQKKVFNITFKHNLQTHFLAKLATLFSLVHVFVHLKFMVLVVFSHFTTTIFFFLQAFCTTVHTVYSLGARTKALRLFHFI